MSKKIKFNRLLYKLFGIDRGNYYNSAIIVAAGTGSRMNSDTTKQLMEIDGMTIAARSIEQFEKCPDIDEIIVVIRREEFDNFKGILRKHNFKKVKHVVAGGETRQMSVFNGLKFVDKQSEFVSIHDAARCLVTPEIITKVSKNAYRFGCATASAPSKDTVKIIDGKGFIKETIDRSTVFSAQTPQIFQTDIYRAAAYSARKDGFVATDDNSLAERLGFKVFLCDTGYENIKITTPEDIVIAESILKLRKNHD